MENESEKNLEQTNIEKGKDQISEKEEYENPKNEKNDSIQFEKRRDSTFSKESKQLPPIQTIQTNESLVTLPLDELPSPLFFDREGEGAALFHKMSWQRLSICLICEAIALGVLSLPKAFSILGMVPGILATIFMGILATYSALIVGELKFIHPQIQNYPDLAKMMFGKFGYILVSIMMTALLTLSAGSHVLTGIMAFQTIFSHSICSVYFGVLAAFLLFLLGLPKTFHKMAILAYIDFASITAAILVTLITASIESYRKPGGWQSTDWYVIGKKDQGSDFIQCTIALTNIALAYAYVHCLPSFMSELYKPIDYRKSVITLGLVQILFYTFVGALLYYFKGSDVQAMSLLSLHPTMQKVVFGLALPVIFVSGSINSHTAARFVYNHIFDVKSIHRYKTTRLGNLTWIGINAIIIFIAFISAEIIPSFPTFLGLKAALFSACFTFTFPSIIFFKFIRYESPRLLNSKLKWSESIVNGIIFGFGFFMFFVGGTCVGISLVQQYRHGIALPFAC